MVVELFLAERLEHADLAIGVDQGLPAPLDFRSDCLVLLRQLLVACMRCRATDLHVEPKQEHYTVRMRVDGSMVDALTLEKPVAGLLVGVVKVLSDIDIAQKHVVQEGHFSASIHERRS